MARRGFVGLLAVVLALPLVAAFPAAGDSGDAEPISLDGGERLAPALAGSLTENVGQIPDDDIRFYASSGGTPIGFGSEDVVLVLREASRPGAGDRLLERETHVPRGTTVRIHFENADPVEPRGADPMAHVSHFFQGPDPEAWRTGVRSFRQVVYEDLYPGVDLVYRLTGEGLKYDFLVSPGADPASIRLRYDGVDELTIDSAGTLIVRTPSGEIRDSAPTSYQGDARVSCDFVLYRADTVGFDCHSVDPRQPLVIDPLVYGTFLGGATTDRGVYVTVDANGDFYIVGETNSPDFPVTPGAFNETLAGNLDVFVAKFDPSTRSLVYATYVGGTQQDRPQGIAVDSAGSAYVTGSTRSSDFPTTPGAYDTVFGGDADIFVTKLAPNGGSLAYSTYLGGTATGGENGYAIAVDSFGSAYVAGQTWSSNFPTTPGAFDPTFDLGGGEAFVTKFTPDGSALDYSTVLGSNENDWAHGIDVDPTGIAVVTGVTYAPDFPTTPGAFDPTANGNTDAFVTAFDPTGSSLVFSTYLGGNRGDEAYDLVLDAAGDVYVTGYTLSANFPVTPGAYDTTFGGGTEGDAFVVKLNATGDMLHYATYVGGTRADVPEGIAVDADGGAYIAGWTLANDFPTTPKSFDRTFGGTQDGFVAWLNASGDALRYATYIGGSDSEQSPSVAVAAPGIAALVGYTVSPDFPITPDAFDATFVGGMEAFLVILELSAENEPPVLTWTGQPGYATDGLEPETGTTATTFTYRVAYADGDGEPPTGLSVAIEKPVGVPWGTFPMAFDSWVGTPDDFSSGAIYTFSTTLPVPGTDYAYRFNATEGFDWATGLPVQASPGPVVTSADEPPIARASASTTVAHMGEDITFDATASTDDLGIVSYAWDFGDGVQDVGAVVTHAYAQRGSFNVTLTVVDTGNQSDSDAFVVSIVNRVPLVDTGPDQFVRPGIAVTLRGSAVDGDGDVLTHLWVQIRGPRVRLSDPTSLTTTFLPPRAGLYAFLLIVDDGWGGTVFDGTVVVVWEPPPPQELPSPTSGSTPRDPATVQDGFLAEPHTIAFWRCRGDGA